MLKRTLLFLVLNFTALAIGGLFTGDGVSSEWYTNLSKAPWTPPGWVFGFAWTSIMICFSFYMAFLWDLTNSKKNILILYALQWLLNTGWNPVFFYAHETFMGLLVIMTLTLLVGFFLFSYWKPLKIKSLLLLPYFLWLLIASSLNAYIYLYN